MWHAGDTEGLGAQVEGQHCQFGHFWHIVGEEGDRECGPVEAETAEKHEQVLVLQEDHPGSHSREGQVEGQRPPHEQEVDDLPGLEDGAAYTDEEGGAAVEQSHSHSHV